MDNSPDRERFPTQSDFVRMAIKRLIRQERRRRIREQIEREMAETRTAVSDRAGAASQVKDWLERLERADRGEL